MQHASYASVYVFHSTVAFRLGPRWSVSYASAALGNLFDSSLIRQDPGLANLRAQAHWGQLDATFGIRRLVANVGLAVVGDDNVGVLESSTLARVNLRVAPLRTRDVTVGAQASRYIGGSVPGREQGRQTIDVTVRRDLGSSVVSIAAAASRGALWRYSETDRGYSIAGQVTVLSVLDLGGAIGWYNTTYGATHSELHKSLGAAVRVGRIHLGTRYTSTRLGVGSSVGFSLAYGAASAR